MKEITINTTGMMCTGCESRMKNALKSLDGVKEVEADHKSGKVEIKCEKETKEEVLKNKIEEIGFHIK